MKIKLLAMLIALISFSSCEKVETSDIELDKSQTVTVEGTVTINSSTESFPSGTKLGILVPTHRYYEEALNKKGAGPDAEDGYQVFEVDVNPDGTYSYELPISEFESLNDRFSIHLKLAFRIGDKVYEGISNWKVVTFTDKKIIIDFTCYEQGTP